MGIVSQSAAKGKTVRPPSDDPQGLLYLTARYIEALRVRHFTEQTLYGRGKMLRYFRVYCEQIGVTQARQVTRAVMINYQSYLYHYRKEDGKALTIGTQKAWLSCVTAFFSWLTREGLALYNPASDLELPRREVRLPKIILNAAEVEAILNVPDLSTPMGVRDRAILETLYSTGIRRQELCNLSLGDIDYDRGLVRIEQGKGHKDRYVPIGDRAVQWIEKYLLDVRPRLCPSLNEQAIFLNTLGTRMNANRLGSQVHEIIRNAGIGKSGSCHLFRHTFATLLLENGCDVRYVQEMLGHSKLETTAVYTHVAIKTLKEVHSRFHPARLPQADNPAR
jgi:integrase/recombinase XerD